MSHLYRCVYQTCPQEFTTWQDMVDHQATPHATGDELTRAYGYGRLAYLESKPDAPGVDARIQTMIADAKVGEPRTIELFREFSLGYRNTAALELPYGVPS